MNQESKNSLTLLRQWRSQLYAWSMTDASSKTLAAVRLYAGSLPVLCSSVNASLGVCCCCCWCFSFFCLLLRLYFSLPRPCAILLLRFSLLVADGILLHSRWWWCVLGSLSYTFTIWLVILYSEPTNEKTNHFIHMHINDGVRGRAIMYSNIAYYLLWSIGRCERDRLFRLYENHCIHCVAIFPLIFTMILPCPSTHTHRFMQCFFFFSISRFNLFRLICRLIRIRCLSVCFNSKSQDCAWKGWMDWPCNTYLELTCCYVVAVVIVNSTMTRSSNANRLTNNNKCANWTQEEHHI